MLLDVVMWGHLRNQQLGSNTISSHVQRVAPRVSISETAGRVATRQHDSFCRFFVRKRLHGRNAVHDFSVHGQQFLLKGNNIVPKTGTVHARIHEINLNRSQNCCWNP